MTAQELDVNRYNWTQRVWDEEADSVHLVGMRKWRDLQTDFQRYLLAKVQNCNTIEEVREALKEQ